MSDCGLRIPIRTSQFATDQTPTRFTGDFAVCTLAIYFQLSRDFPLVIAAKRDELLDRPTLPPHSLCDDPRIIGGQDVQAGGTWLGVNSHNVVAGLLNRRTSQPLDSRRRSRGLLCLDALRARTPAAAAQEICGRSSAAYNPFNLLLASPDQACVVGNFSGHMLCTTLTPGLHLLTNLELNDMECPRIAKSVGFFEAAAPLLNLAQLAEFLGAIKAVLSDHSTPLDPRSDGPPNNLCVHRDGYGTRSSTIIVYSAVAAHMRMWFANGPPCRTDYEEIVWERF